MKNTIFVSLCFIVVKKIHIMSTNNTVVRELRVLRGKKISDKTGFMWII
jgi:hypothetical protein